MLAPSPAVAWVCADANPAASTMTRTAPMSRGATASARDGIFLQLRVELQGKLQVGGFVAREGHRILAGVAGRAVFRPATLDPRCQTFEAEIGDAVSVEVLPDFLHRVGRGDELRATRCVDA